ncbi:MAG: VOC family protein [Sphingobium sp.]|jgi:lactoylglutathione lyase|nr:VOC family protein [Sphingobium sp.]
MSTAAPAIAEVPADLGFRLNFFKLIVADMEAAIAFYAGAFGMVEAGPRVDLPEVEEAMLTMPGDRFTLVLYRWKDGRDLAPGTAHGPVGFLTKDVDAAYARLLDHGATSRRKPFTLGPMKIAFVADPEGHEVELVQFVRNEAPSA